MLCLGLVELPMKMCKNSLWLIFKETPSKLIWLYKAQGLQLGDHPMKSVDHILLNPPAVGLWKAPRGSKMFYSIM